MWIVHDTDISACDEMCEYKVGCQLCYCQVGNRQYGCGKVYVRLRVNTKALHLIWWILKVKGVRKGGCMTAEQKSN